MPDHDNGFTPTPLEPTPERIVAWVLELVEDLEPGDKLIIEAHEPAPGKATITAKVKSRS